ncbi:hypothetical protein U9M48_021959, partial [Paspalum notatum var. saurae]
MVDLKYAKVVMRTSGCTLLAASCLTVDCLSSLSALLVAWCRQVDRFSHFIHDLWWPYWRLRSRDSSPYATKAEYAISMQYDRSCVCEEVLQNKRLNKYNHAAIDEQFHFYQSDGLVKFNDSGQLPVLPSYVPEGSFIVRVHTPMSNLFPCLWFNEVNRFTSRDQLSFTYTYLKLRRTNPGIPFRLNMFKYVMPSSVVTRGLEQRQVWQEPGLQLLGNLGNNAVVIKHPPGFHDPDNGCLDLRTKIHEHLRYAPHQSSVNHFTHSFPVYKIQKGVKQPAKDHGGVNYVVPPQIQTKLMNSSSKNKPPCAASIDFDISFKRQ